MGMIMQPEVTEQSADLFAKFGDDYIDLKPVFLDGGRSYTTAALKVDTVIDLLALTAVKEEIDSGELRADDYPGALVIHSVYYTDSGVLKEQVIKDTNVVKTDGVGSMASDSYLVDTLVGKINVLFNKYTGGLEAIPKRSGRIVAIKLALERKSIVTEPPEGYVAPEEVPAE